MKRSYPTRRALASFLIFTLTTSVFWTSFGCGGGSNFSGNLAPEPNTGPQKGVVLYINDHLGNAHLITDSQGNILREESRYPYGLDWRVDGSDATTADYVYTGKEYDEDIGLVYFGGRYYSPEMGRWITPDPLFLENPNSAATRPLESNLYSYATGNPINFVDPNGEWVQFALLAVSAATMLASDTPGGVTSFNANFATAITPIVNDYRDIYELATGKDLITKQGLSFEDRAKCAFGLIVGSGAFYRGIKPHIERTDWGNVNAFWPGNRDARAIFKPISDGGVEVSWLSKGSAPKYSGGPMLADALKEAGISKPNYVLFYNVQESNYGTLKMLENNFPVEDTLLGNTMKNTVDALGGKITSMNAFEKAGKYHIKADINYE